MRFLRLCLTGLLFAPHLPAVARGYEGPQAGIDFDTDVVPVLTKCGCNAAACHGSAMGRGGFKLSLFGGDPRADYHAIVHQLEGRRVNFRYPEDSLLLAKPIGNLEHGGGERLEYDGYGAKTIENWVRSGASRTPPNGSARRQLVRNGVTVDPAHPVLGATPVTVQLQVAAIFTQKSGELEQRDVTELAVYSSADTTAVEVDDVGSVNVLRPGRHTIVVRFLSEVVPVTITAPLAKVDRDLSRALRLNWIDGHVNETLADLGLRTAGQTTDAEFLRRIRLDLTGRLPTPEEIQTFDHDVDAEKRKELVDRLLESPEFTTYWTYRFAQLLRIRPQGGDRQGARAFYDWLQGRIEQRTGWDEVASTLLTATGDSHQHGPPNFHRVAGDARGEAEYVSEALMGVRLRCANCHNHPLDRWTQDDYHGLAAIFARLGRGQIVSILARGDVENPATGESAVPKLPAGAYLEPSEDNRERFARWLTRPSNPFFATAMVNQLWSALMGRGLVEPVGDLRATNPATHPELLDELARDFCDHNFDIRHTLRQIANSAAYSRASRAGRNHPPDDRFYSVAIVKPLPAEVLADAFVDVTGVAEQYGDEPLGTRAVELVDPTTDSRALDVLGRCLRDAPCQASPTASSELAARLHMINGALINAKIAAPDGRLQERITSGATDDTILDEFHLRTRGRLPTPPERAYWLEQLAATDGPTARRECLEDMVWALLVSPQFQMNQ